ncbi:MAG: hypothetical protein JNM47_10805 [Hyphomonadaceae bacterium]|nr:hypothetical protein [Hyphomonadaceae bacterium]
MPEGVHQLDAIECSAAERLFEARVEVSSTPPVSENHIAKTEIVRPGAGYVVWTVPDGILCFIEDYPQLNLALEEQINALAPSGMSAWAVGDAKNGCFRGSFNTSFRRWLKTEFILSPLALVSPNAQLVMVFDEQMRFGLIGAERSIAPQVLRALGGNDNVRAIMGRYIEDFGVGFGEDDRTWARRYLVN